MHIDHRLWLLTTEIYTKKCGYSYNPFWLLPIVHGYIINPSIGHFKLAIVIGIGCLGFYWYVSHKNIMIYFLLNHFEIKE
jgi:hypothetical protein